MSENEISTEDKIPTCRFGKFLPKKALQEQEHAI